MAIRIRADDGVSVLNEKVTYAITFPNYQALTCPSTSIQLISPLNPIKLTQPLKISKNRTQIQLPGVTDTLSQMLREDYK